MRPIRIQIKPGDLTAMHLHRKRRDLVAPNLLRRDDVLVAVIDPDEEYAAHDLPNFVPAHQYSPFVPYQPVRGEIGRFESWRVAVRGWE